MSFGGFLDQRGLCSLVFVFIGRFKKIELATFFYNLRSCIWPPGVHFLQENWENRKAMINKLSQLRYEVMTDKRLAPFDPAVSIDDFELWDKAFQLYEAKRGKAPTWFTSPWLFWECYVYRCIQLFADTSWVPCKQPENGWWNLKLCCYSMFLLSPHTPICCLVFILLPCVFFIDFSFIYFFFGLYSFLRVKSVFSIHVPVYISLQCAAYLFVDRFKCHYSLF